MKIKKDISYLRTFRILSIFLLTPILIIANGCAGTMRGFVREGCKPVVFQFVDNGYDGGNLSATLYDGENYKGEYKYTTSSTVGFGFSPGYNYSGNYNQFGITSVYASTTYSSFVQAKLGGSKGHLMECQFVKRYPGESLVFGGNGLCRTSDRKIIDIMWIGKSVTQLQENEVVINNENSVRILDNDTIFYIPTGTKWMGDAVLHAEELPGGHPLSGEKRKYWKLKINSYIGCEIIK